jgi:DMSO/TMAO reductase YedYZ molybdopterin-dependent catalytic subunit
LFCGIGVFDPFCQNNKVTIKKGVLSMSNNRWNIVLVALGMCASWVFLIGTAYGSQSPKSDNQESSLVIIGEVKSELILSLADIQSLPPFFIRNVPVIPERVRDRKDEERVSQTNFRGVLLRDLLYKAGMKYERKWEPGVLVRVSDADGREVVFSFGEIFYSSIGRSILIAYERNDKAFPPTLVVATDIHNGRMLEDVAEISVGRVNVELLAYDDKAKNLQRPPTTEFKLIDIKNKTEKVIKPEDLKGLPVTHVPAAVMIGDCEGFHGIHSLDGVALSTLLKHYLQIPDPAPYNRYVLISSEDGYCATYSFGELFNSRLGDQVVIATVKDGEPLSPADGFAMSVTGEDSTGGRSVKRIAEIEVY